MGYKKDITGQKFNKLSVLSFSHNGKDGSAHWLCICDCGNYKTVVTTKLTTGVIKSCGCLRNENCKHKMATSAIYKRWAAMKYRCKDLGDPVYGGKGITYTPEWETFDRFYVDMNEGFKENLELDRIDVTKGYYKENCRWVTHSENNYNKNIQSNNTSGKTGVCWKPKNNKWLAYITINRKQKNLGLFENLSDAIAARVDAELKYYGYTRP